jgi:hypothetical protein
MPAIPSSHPPKPLAAALLAVTAALSASAAPLANQPAPAPPKAQIAQNYGKLPLSFEANQGQSDPQVKFLSRGNGYSLFLTNRAAVLSLTKPANTATGANAASGLVKGHGFILADKATKTNGALAPEAKPQTDTIAMQLANANPNAKIEGADPLPGHTNYFLGNDPKKWQTNVPTYAKVQYKNVYNGIDLVYYGNQRQLEYDFIVQPGKSPKAIQLDFAGAQKLKLTPNGDLEVIAKNGQIAFHKPEIYQEKTVSANP